MDRSVTLGPGSRQADLFLGDVVAGEQACARGTVAVAAQLIGLARRMLADTVDYAKIREQFGRPIGSFQAVQHRLADATVELELAAPLVYRAAWCVEHEHADQAIAVSMAKERASDAAMTASQAALQVHGAIGYSFECDLHLFMKRAWVLGAHFGSADWHRRRLAHLLLAH